MLETTAAMRGELTKLRQVRSCISSLLVFIPVSVLVAALNGWSARSALNSGSLSLRADFTPQQAGLDGVLYGQLALIVFGVLMVAGEFTSGMIQVSLLAVPRRGRFFLSKIVVIGLSVTGVSIPVTLAAYLVTQVALGPYGASITDPGVLAALTGSVAYLTLMTLFAAGVAAIARNAVFPLIVLLPMVLAGSHLLALLGATKDIARYLPDQAGTELLTVQSGNAVFGFAVMTAWASAALLLGWFRHLRWDG